MSAVLNEDRLYSDDVDFLPTDKPKISPRVRGLQGYVDGLANWKEQHAISDLLASVVVFLAALPLCMSIAIASGVPPVLGIITGIIGGIFVGIFAGSPLLISGPAAGLAVIIWELVQTHGIAVLGPIVLLSGIFQMIAGSLSMGQWFRAVSPSVIHGMLAGIGVTIVANQAFVMMDTSPVGNGIRNLLVLPSRIYEVLESLQGLSFAQILQPINGSSVHLALGIGLLTLAIMISWTNFIPKKFQMLPASLVAVAVASVVAGVLQLPINYVGVPSSLLDAVQLPSMTEIPHLFNGPIFTAALVVAYIASAETLLSAAAVDRMHKGPRTKYDKEMFAQGMGNAVCGFLGALPMTGVIARSGTNVAAGARTRASTILHGCWILLFILLLPFVLQHVPIAALSAVLVIVGCKMINPHDVRRLKAFGKSEVNIYFITLGIIVATNLLDGVLIGIGLAFGKTMYSLIHLDTKLTIDRKYKLAVLKLSGSATFIQLPKLARKLERVPTEFELHINIEELGHIDPACLELFESWGEAHELTGGSLILEWQALMGKYDKKIKQQRKLAVGNPGKQGWSVKFAHPTEAVSSHGSGGR